MRLLLILVFATTAAAAEFPSIYSRFCATCGIRDADSFVSQSGQFVIHGNAIPPTLPSLGPSEKFYVVVEPQGVAAAAERAKRSLLVELGLQEAFGEKIHIVILPRAPVTQPITIVSRQHPDGFIYQMGVPIRVEQTRLTKGLVQALLTDFANRGSRRAAELPTWLVEGMTRQVMATISPTYVANKRLVTFDVVGYDRLARARNYFQTNNCLTIQELSFPKVDFNAIEERDQYQNSAHLFVHQLLKLPRGKRLMAQFIKTLPNALNWQTAFHSVYHREFPGPLDLEKWWALTWINFKKSGEHETWPITVSLQKLEALLMTSIETSVQTNSLPERKEVKLQSLLTDTDFSLQKQVIEQKLQQMFFLAFNLHPEVSALAAKYQQVLRSYVERRSVADYQPSLRSDPEARKEALVKAVSQELDGVDKLWPQIAAKETAPAP